MVRGLALQLQGIGEGLFVGAYKVGQVLQRWSAGEEEEEEEEAEEEGWEEGRPLRRTLMKVWPSSVSMVQGGQSWTACRGGRAMLAQQQKGGHQDAMRTDRRERIWRGQRRGDTASTEERRGVDSAAGGSTSERAKQMLSFLGLAAGRGVLPKWPTAGGNERAEAGLATTTTITTTTRTTITTTTTIATTNTNTVLLSPTMTRSAVHGVGAGPASVREKRFLSTVAVCVLPTPLDRNTHERNTTSALLSEGWR